MAQQSPGGDLAETKAASKAAELTAAPFPPRPPRGYTWRSVLEIEPGMVVARPVYGNAGMQMTMHLAAGSSLTASTIGQLVNKGVECIAVQLATPPDEAIDANIVEQYESRLHEIFGPQPSEACRPLFDALLADLP